MQEWFIIYKIIRSASKAFFRMQKKNDAFHKAKDYLADKYDLEYEQQTLNYVDETITNYMFDREWWDKLLKLLKKITKASSYSKKIAELSADSCSFIFVLDFNHLSKYRSANNKLLKSKIFSRLNKLAEGEGSDVLLELVQDDLRAFLEAKHT